MLGERFADLDELILLCRDKEAKMYIGEAVACYRAGAYRACIVATWTAVVYDFIHKLRELELTGDANARKRLGEFETIRVSANVQAALVFERSVLELAKDEFELLTPLEHIDLARLLEDRNRCAHPSMNSSEDVYLPSAELTRYHLRSAVTHMLQHPPVQGKAALDRLINEVFSPYFPHSVDAAIIHFKQGPLARPRPALVRNFVLVLLKALLLDPDKVSIQYQLVAALEAVRTMHRATAELPIYERINEIVRNMRDEDLARTIVFIGHISNTWERLTTDIQSRIKMYVQNMPDADLDHCLTSAFLTDALRQEAAYRLARITSMKTIVKIAEEVPLDEFVQRAIEIYLLSNSFSEARTNAWLLERIIRHLQPRQIEQIIKGASQNGQITGGGAFPSVVRHLRATNKLTDAQLSELLDKYSLETIRESVFGEVGDNIPF